MSNINQLFLEISILNTDNTPQKPNPSYNPDAKQTYTTNSYSLPSALSHLNIAVKKQEAKHASIHGVSTRNANK